MKPIHIVIIVIILLLVAMSGYYFVQKGRSTLAEVPEPLIDEEGLENDPIIISSYQAGQQAGQKKATDQDKKDAKAILWSGGLLLPGVIKQKLFG